MANKSLKFVHSLYVITTHHNFCFVFVFFLFWFEKKKPLHLAARITANSVGHKNKDKIIKLLLGHSAIDLKSYDKSEKTPFHVLIDQSDETNLHALLLKLKKVLCVFGVFFLTEFIFFSFHFRRHTSHCRIECKNMSPKKKISKKL